MISSRTAVLLLCGLVLPFTLTACPTPGAGKSAPKTGVITQLVPGSAACLDQGTASVAVQYQPEGKDAKGAHWPATVACVTPEAATALVLGGRFQE